jgi:sugar lactone lactonase YvrE
VCGLGEGPTWDADAGVVRWVDIEGGALYEAPIGVGARAGVGASTGADGVGPTRTVLTVDGTLGAAVHAEGGGFLLATSRHLEHRDASGATEARWELIPAGQPRRLNDGACDPAGRYVVGSLSLGGMSNGSSSNGGFSNGGALGGEQLWRLEHDGTVTVLDEGLSLSNGIAWSPDGRVMYHVDTMRHRVYSRSYDFTTGDVGHPSVLIDTDQALPDGLAVDGAGDLWIAMWGEGEIRRFAPDGTQRGALRTGVPRNSSCAFVGPELDLLVVTSASGDVPPRHRADAADAADADADANALDGRLLAIRTSVTGLPTRAWRPCANGEPQ